MYEEVIASQPTEWQAVVKTLNAPRPKGGLLYIKHMTHHMTSEVDLGSFRDHRNCFLIRDPARVIASYAAKWDQITTEDIGIKRQLEIYRTLKDLTGECPVVIEAEDILRQPETMLKKLCTALDIPWTPAMLSWNKGRHPEDGVWAEHWYAAVEQTTGFAPYEEREVELKPDLMDLLTEQLPYYEELSARKI
jgi:hypothetical protein